MWNAKCGFQGMTLNFRRRLEKAVKISALVSLHQQSVWKAGGGLETSVKYSDLTHWARIYVKW